MPGNNRSSWKSLLPDDDPLFQPDHAPSKLHSSLTSATSHLSSLSLAHGPTERRLSSTSTSQLSTQSSYSASIPSSRVPTGSLAPRDQEDLPPPGPDRDSWLRLLHRPDSPALAASRAPRTLTASPVPSASVSRPTSHSPLALARNLDSRSLERDQDEHHSSWPTVPSTSSIAASHASHNDTLSPASVPQHPGGHPSPDHPSPVGPSGAATHTKEENLDQVSSRSAPPNLAPTRALSPSSSSPAHTTSNEYARARELGQAGTPQLPRTTRSWNGQRGEPEYLVQYSPVPTTPFLERRPAPPETNLEVETYSWGYTIRLNLPGFSIEGLTLTVKHHRTIHIVADKWDSDSGGHFERRVVFGPDADMRSVRAQFDGALLLIHVPLRQKRTTRPPTGTVESSLEGSRSERQASPAGLSAQASTSSDATSISSRSTSTLASPMPAPCVATGLKGFNGKLSPLPSPNAAEPDSCTATPAAEQPPPTQQPTT